MRRIVLAVIAFCAAAAVHAKSSTPKGWTDDYDAALRRAAAEGKYVLANFSGSDWCGWCHRLDEEVFATDAFRSAAPGKYVLLMVDSPDDKDLLSEKARVQNPKLVEKYAIKGFPTVLVLDSKGEVVASLGYSEGGPEAYLATVESEISIAPLRKKYLKPIEDALTRHDREIQAEIDAVLAKARGRFPMPSAGSPAAEAEKARDSFRSYVEGEIFGKIVPRYVPLYEKAFAEVKAMEVPESLRRRRDDFIAEQESRFEAMKDAKRKYDAAAKAK